MPVDRFRRTHLALLLSLPALVFSPGCGGGGGGGTPPPPPAPVITVTVTPGTASVFLGATQQFTATVTGTTNTSVLWTLAPVPAGSCLADGCGTLNATGLYTAPPILSPDLTALLVRATSLADATKFAETRMTLTSDITITITPPSPTVLRTNTVQFTAMLTASGNPNRDILWSLEDAQGGSCFACGNLNATGFYTAPDFVPLNPQIFVRARSIGDHTKSARTQVLLTSDLAVSISPDVADVELGGMLPLQITITGTAPIGGFFFRIEVQGIPVETGFGSFSGSRYDAPRIKPPADVVTIRVLSNLDPNKSATATVTIRSSFTVSISGPSAVNTGATQNYSLAVSSPPNSNPDRGATWALSCSAGQDCGTANSISSGSVSYTAPLMPPTPAQVTLRATSVADPSKTATLDVTINNEIAVFLPASVGVEIEKTLQFDAVVAGTQNTAVVWDVNGIVGGNTTIGTITQTGSYAAPDIIPPTGLVSVRATSVADPTKSATSSVRIFSQISVSISPFSSTRAVNRRQGLTVMMTTPSGPPRVQDVTWMVNGIPNGDSTVGQICLAGSNPCLIAPGPTSSPVEYLAPASVPAGNPVLVRATSIADTQRRGVAQVTIIPAVQVSVSPSLATLGLSTAQQPITQQFTASILGTSNQNVTWSISGAGCAANACGTISSTGLYTAPTAAPTPPTLSVVATSVEDPVQSGSATVTIGTGPTITFLNPTSITAGASFNFYTLRVGGFNFVSTVSGAGSKLIVNGIDRGGSGCPLTTQCSITFQTSDLSTPREITIQVENPPAVQGDPPVRSNQVTFLVVAEETAEEVISLLASAPEASGKDVFVVDKTCADPGGSCLGANVAAVGVLVSGNCNASSSPISLARPTAGTMAFDVCVQGSGFDITSTYSISGPSPNDIAISNVRTFGLGVALTLTISTNTAPGPRTILVRTAARERSASTGAIEVK